MSKKPDLSFVAGAVESLHEQDKKLVSELEAQRGRRTEMPLGEIRARPHGDSRGIDPKHVESLADSIVALGLLEPLVVDRHGNLIAGAHRWSALKLLAERGLWAKQAPVRMLEDIDADKDPAGALAAEVAENEKRRDYTREEILALAERLKRAGFKATRGRPKSGQRSVAPTLAAVVGKSLRRVEQVLAGQSVATKNRNVSVLASLRRLDHDAEQAGKQLARHRKPAAARVKAALDRLRPLLAAALEEMKGE